MPENFRNGASISSRPSSRPRWTGPSGIGFTSVLCTCLGGRPRIEWPLRRALPARFTPESAYLLATWGARMPYRRAATLLRALLPLRRSDISYGSVRRCTLEIGRRIENRAIDREEYEWESPGRRPVAPADHVLVAIDGTGIRAAPGAYGRQLQVIAGRIERDGQLGGHFAWVPEAVGATGAMMRSALDDDGLTSQYFHRERGATLRLLAFMGRRRHY